MENVIVYVTVALGISVVINLILKKLGIAQVIGYILTGTIIVYAFDLRHMTDSHTLEQIAEFGIVFLMFTIGLELSVEKLITMKKELISGGLMQVSITALIVYILSFYLFNITLESSMIIAMAFALSSTAIVLSYLKSSKEIYMPYGQQSMAILIFQDIAVIPILLLIGFLSTDDGDIVYILMETALSAILVVGILFIVGKRLMTWLLHFAAESHEEELFIGSVLVIAVGASLLAHSLGFTYSLGAFVAGMIIAETKYHHKVESDIASFKDLLLGTFFVTVGMKIDLIFFIGHFVTIFTLLIGVMLLKSIIIFIIISRNSNKSIGMQTALALSQVGEFSFAIFALASGAHLIDPTLEQILILMVVSSMIITPFIITRINSITSKFFKSLLLENNFGSFTHRKNHVIVCGYSIVGKFVTDELKIYGAPYVIIDNSLKHVKEGLEKKEEIYLGDMSKSSISKSLHVEDAAAVIVTVDNLEKKRLICEAVLKYNPQANLVVKITSLYEKEKLSDLPITVIVDSKREIANILVESTMRCQLSQ